MKTWNAHRIPARPRGRPGGGRGDPDGSMGAGRHGRLGGLIAACAVAMLVPLAGTAFAEDDVTRSALEISYGREQNARAHYLAFAAGALREGEWGAAHLFRAAAGAESIHAARVAAVIEQLGGRPTWRIESVLVGGTQANLRHAIEQEKQECARVYPRFATYAREECLYEAAATFSYAGTAEGTHLARFREALEAFEGRLPPQLARVAAAAAVEGPAACAATLYLCTGDGSLFASPVGSCPNCGTGNSRVRAITAPAPGARTGGPGPLASR